MTQSTTRLRPVLAAPLFALALSALPACAQDSPDLIRLTLHDWTGQLITTTLMGGILKAAGSTVVYVQADYLAQFAGLESGDLDVAMEIWAATGQEAMDAALVTGKVENLGSTGMQAQEERWYPTCMAETCPGLPDWEALKDPACAEAFATAETAPKGRYLCGPVTWGGFDEERIEALDLPFEVIHAGTDTALFAELESAYERRAPILLWLYASHWAPARYEGQWIAFPEYTAACYDDPAWDSNPDLAHDCGKPFGEIWKVGGAGLRDKWPMAYAAIRAFTIGNDEMGAVITEVDLNGKTVDQVVADWMAANEARWRGWIGQ